jgi:hypothetical protein
MLRFMTSVALGLTLMLSVLPASAQGGPSPLDGNWQITGSRERKQYPAISMFIHVNGRQVHAAGNSMTVCANTGGTFGGGFRLTGEIEPAGNFTLRSPSLPLSERLIVVGKMPPAGSVSWDGTYTVKSPMNSQCVFDQSGAFTGSPLAPLTGVFSGQVMRMYPFPIPEDASPDYLNKTLERLKLSITLAQGDYVFHERKNGPPDAYLPLTGTIQMVGCPCFIHGTSVAEFENSIQGDLVRMKFKMDDESELLIESYYVNSDASLSFRAHVKDGKCAGLGFMGTVSRQ